MTSIRLKLTGATAKAEVTGTLTSGMVGIPVTIEYDKEWEGLQKNLICQSDAGTWTVLEIGEQAAVAPEALQYTKYGKNELFLGVEGRNVEGDLVLPSTMAYCGQILLSTQVVKEKSEKMSSLKVQYVNVPEKISWHQCPENIQKFIAEVTYDSADYSVSHIDRYAPAVPLMANYKPIGTSVGEKTFYNEVPGVATPFVAGDAYGAVKPLDQVRYINTPYAPNVRDLGGWKCDGGTVKYGLLFRGGEPRITDRPVLVEELGIRHDLNLRGAAEATWDISPLGDDVYFTRADTYNWYTLAKSDVWRTNLRCVFDAVTHNEPVFFHCAAGADRTGTLACVLEGLLGMSQSDIDKDYELTCFYSGTGTDGQGRRRNEPEWQGLINEINEKKGATFRDKCVTFAAELGFTAEEINAFRAAMIEGTPETVAPTISQMTVTNTLDYGISSDNAETTIAQYQPYGAKIQCADGYAIGTVKVIMDGIDITGQVWNGKKTNLYRGIQFRLSGCASSNKKHRVIEGQGYATYITADAGYKLEGAEVRILMGGNDVSNYYSDGVIAIPNVTGNVVITVTALESATANVDQMVVQPGNINKRISGNGTINESAGCFICDPIAVDLTKSCPITFKGFAANMGTLGAKTYELSKVVLLDADKSPLATWYIGRRSVETIWEATISGEDVVGDLVTIFNSAPTAGTAPTASAVAYAQFSPQISQSSISASDLAGLEIIVPEA